MCVCVFFGSSFPGFFRFTGWDCKQSVCCWQFCQLTATPMSGPLFYTRDALGELWLLNQRFPPEEKEKEVCRGSGIISRWHLTTPSFYI